MSKKEKDYLVIDLEMTCEEPRPKGYKPEIIEIGIVKVDLDGNVKSREQILVKPTHNTISDFCTELTGHTFENLKRNGIPLESAFNKIKKLGSRNKKIIAWGEDWKQFEMEADWKGLENPLSGRYLNLSMLHSVLHRTVHKTALEDAIEYYGVEKVGKLHSGVDDAHNTALVFKAMLDKFNI